MALEAFLKIEGIPGESRKAGHPDEIDILSFSFGASQPDVVMDFWVMEEAGVVVVFDSWHEAGATSTLVDAVERAALSTRFVAR